MKYLRQVKQLLFKQGARSFVVFLQMLIGFTSLSIAIGVFIHTDNYIKSIEKINSKETLRLYLEDTGSNTSSEKLMQFYDELKLLKRVKNVGTYLSQDIPFAELQNNAHIIDEEKRKSGSATVIFLDDTAIDWFQFDFKSGRALNSQDVTTEALNDIPVMIGNKLADQFPIGSVLNGGIADDRKMTIIPKRFVVVGVLKSPITFWKGGSSSLDDSIFDSDTAIISPMQEEQNYGGQLLDRLSMNLMLEGENTEQTIQLKSDISKLIGSFNYKGRITTIGEQIDHLKKLSRPLVIFTLTFAALILFLSSFGLVGVMLISILERYREFGVRFAYGATINSLILLVLGEILSILTAASLVGLAISFSIDYFLKLPISVEISPLTLAISFGVVVILTVMTTILPIVKLKRTDPIKLIRGAA